MNKEVFNFLGKTNFEGKVFSIYGTRGFPLFRAKDIVPCVSSWKKFSNNDVWHIFSQLSDCYKTRGIAEGTTWEVWFITEQGLYVLLDCVGGDMAMQFKKEIHDILDETRYEVEEKSETNTPSKDGYSELSSAIDMWTAGVKDIKEGFKKIEEARTTINKLYSAINDVESGLRVDLANLIELSED